MSATLKYFAAGGVVVSAILGLMFLIGHFFGAGWVVAILMAYIFANASYNIGKGLLTPPPHEERDDG